MATYKELYDLKNNSELRNRITVACLVAAEVIRSEDATTANHANRLKWAKQVYEGPEQAGLVVLPAVLAANRAFTVAQITGATDDALQTAVANVVNLLATG